MSRFCDKCGTKVDNEEKFCPKCGNKLNDEQIVNVQPIKQNGKSKNTLLKVIIGILLVIIIFFVASLGVYFYKNRLNSDEAAPQNATSSSQQASSDTSSANDTQNAKDNKSTDILKQANQILQDKNFKTTISAVSKLDDDGFLGCIEEKGAFTFVVYDKKDDVVATIDYDKNLLNLKNNKSGKMYNPLILNVRIVDDKAQRDNELGYWENNTHIFSIYSVYDVNDNGEIVPGMLTSASGKNPSHYQAYLNEQQNVNIINTALTHVDSLREDMNSRNIKY